jgi:biotin operon repressor
MRIAIISCASKKADYACSAYEMYSISNTFKTQADLASKMYDEYYIMSAKYGIITPNKEIEPYNLTLHTKRLTSGNLITEEQKISLKARVKKQVQYLLDQGYEIDFHLSTDYYALLNLSHQNHPHIIHIKPQKLQSVTVQLYKEGIEMFDNGSNIDEVITYLTNTVKTGNDDRESEQPSWWYHPIENPFWGRSHELAKVYRLNDGNLFMHYHQDTVQSKHVMGWTNQLENLKQLKQTDSGSWRICSKNDISFVTEQRLQEIEEYKQNNIPQEKIIQPKVELKSSFDDLDFENIKSKKITNELLGKIDLVYD